MFPFWDEFDHQFLNSRTDGDLLYHTKCNAAAALRVAFVKRLEYG